MSSISGVKVAVILLDNEDFERHEVAVSFTARLGGM